MSTLNKGRKHLSFQNCIVIWVLFLQTDCSGLCKSLHKNSDTQCVTDRLWLDYILPWNKIASICLIYILSCP